MEITIKASDGKLFSGSDFKALETEVNDYEASLEARRLELEKRRKKAEEERKAKADAKEYKYNQVLDKIEALNKVVESYEKETGEKLRLISVDGRLNGECVGYIGEYTGMPIVNLSTHDDWWNRLYKSLIV